VIGHSNNQHGLVAETFDMSRQAPFKKHVKLLRIRVIYEEQGRERIARPNLKKTQRSEVSNGWNNIRLWESPVRFMENYSNSWQKTKEKNIGKKKSTKVKPKSRVKNMKDTNAPIDLVWKVWTKDENT